MDDGKKYEQKTCVTFEFLEDVGQNVILQSALNTFVRETGKRVAVYYFTIDEHYLDRIATLVVSNLVTGTFKVNCPLGEELKTMILIRDLNPHLDISIVNSGFELSDFEKMRTTVVCKYTIIYLVI